MFVPVAGRIETIRILQLLRVMVKEPIPNMRYYVISFSGPYLWIGPIWPKYFFYTCLPARVLRWLPLQSSNDTPVLRKQSI